MRKIPAIYIYISSCLLIITSLEAQGRSVEVTLTGEELIVAEPRGIVTAVLQVSSKTSEKREFTSDLRLPKGWTPITRDFPFELDANESDIRLVSFFIPQAALAGRYEIIYLVKERDYPSISDFCTLYVTVLPITILEAKLVEAPEYVIAGDVYRACFVVTNGGNTKSTVSIKIHSEESLPFTVDAEALQLAPGESKTVTVTVKTDARIRDILRHRLELTARVLEDKGSKAHATSYVEIIPRMTGSGDRFHRIPVEIATSGHASYRREETRSGLQMEVSGEGTLDEEGERYVDFLFREPDIRAKSTLGEYDEYRFNFRTEDYELGIGDNNYYLSPLTDSYRYGRGIRGKVSLSNFSLGAHYQKARWIRPEQKRAAGYINYSIAEKHRIGLNYFSKKNGIANAGIVSLHGRLEPVKNTDVELECASGEDDYAYLLRVYGYHHGWLSYFLNVIHAEPDYPGYYRDLDLFSANIAAPLRSKFRLNASFRQTKNNLDLDPTLYSARLERYYQLGLNYRFATSGNVSLEYRNRGLEDRFPQPKFNFSEKTYRLGAGHSFQKLTLNTYVEFGKSRDDLTGQSSELKIYNLSTYFRPTSRQSYDGYIHYRNSNGSFTEEKQHSITAGLNSSIRISNRTYLRLNFHTYKYQYLGRDLRSRNLETQLIHTLRNKHKILVRGRHTSFRNSDAIALMVEYTVPLRLPVSRKEGTGVVKGYVYNEESKEPISDVILRFNGATAVTDEHGYFTFPFLKPGTYHINVNAARVGMNLIAVQKTPIEAIVEGGKETFIEIGIARSAALSGQITLYVFENGNGNGHGNGNGYHNGFLNGNGHKAKLVKSHGLANILVELINGSETKRRVTDRKGHFSFEELRPGKWTLRIHDYGLPEYHYLEKDALEFELKPGERAEVLVKVLPKKRRIRIIEEGGTIREEEEKTEGDGNVRKEAR